MHYAAASCSSFSDCSSRIDKERRPGRKKRRALKASVSIPYRGITAGMASFKDLGVSDGLLYDIVDGKKN